jgi:hypothetical protein
MEPDPSGIHPSSGKNVEDAKIQISLMLLALPNLCVDVVKVKDAV